MESDMIHTRVLWDADISTSLSSHEQNQQSTSSGHPLMGFGAILTIRVALRAYGPAQRDTLPRVAIQQTMPSPMKSDKRLSRLPQDGAMSGGNLLLRPLRPSHRSHRACAGARAPLHDSTGTGLAPSRGTMQAGSVGGSGASTRATPMRALRCVSECLDSGASHQGRWRTCARCATGSCSVDSPSR